MDHNAAKPAAVALDATGGLLIEQLGGEFGFQNATPPIALQAKKLTRLFRLTDAAANALAPLVFGEGAR